MFNNNSYSSQSSPLEGIKAIFYKKDVLSRLIIINVVVFVAINVFALILFLFGLDQEFVLAKGTNRLTYYLSLPSDISLLIWRPWSLITYMFVQEGIFHLFFNMLVLYVGGRIFNQFIGEDKLLSVYILSGLTGALLYILTFNIFPAFNNVLSVSYAIGASASVLGIFVAAATFSPNLLMNVILLGNVKLKYIAIVFIVLDILNIRNGNAGGHIAHLGGAFFGFLFVQQLRKNKDWSLLFNSYFQSVAALFYGVKKKKDPFKKVYKNPRKTKTEEEYLRNKNKKQAEIDIILEKIKKSGYESLSAEEKQKLFDASNE